MTNIRFPVGFNYGTFVEFIDDIMEAQPQLDVHYVIELALTYNLNMSTYAGRQMLRRAIRRRYGYTT
jgi:hypothetical protein